MVSYRQNFSYTEGCLMSTEPETVRRDWRIPDEVTEQLFSNRSCQHGNPILWDATAPCR